MLYVGLDSLYSGLRGIGVYLIGSEVVERKDTKGKGHILLHVAETSEVIDERLT